MIWREKNALESNNDTRRRALFELFNGKLNDFLYFLFHDALHRESMFQPDYFKKSVIEMLIPTKCRSLKNLLEIRDAPYHAENGATLGAQLPGVQVRLDVWGERELVASESSYEAAAGFMKSKLTSK